MSKKRNLAATMRSYLRHRYPDYQGGKVPCDNCGLPITPKYENVAHVIRRSKDKNLAHDFSNLRIWCAPTDYWGKKDTSCHTLYDSGRMDEFEAKQEAA